jgi:hypothetical protein
MLDIGVLIFPQDSSTILLQGKEEVSEKSTVVV